MKRIYSLIILVLLSLAAIAQQLVELPYGAKPEPYTLRAVQYNSTPSGWQQTMREENIVVAFVGDDVYVRGLAYWFRGAYVRGHFNDAGDIVFASGQYVGSDDYGAEYIVGLRVPESEGEDYTLADYVFKFDEEERTLTLDGNYIFGESEVNDAPDMLYDYISSAVLAPGVLPLPPTVEVPEGAEKEAWYFSAFQDGEQVVRPIAVAFDGSDVYIQGLCEYLPESWVLGRSYANGIATFATGQFYGQVDGNNLYFLGYDGYNVKDVDFKMNREQGWMATQDFVVLNASDTEFDPYSYDTEVELSREVPQPLELIDAPEGVTITEYLLTAKSNEYSEGDPKKGIPAGIQQEDYSASVQVAIDGKDVYIQGLSSDCPDGWARGTLSDDGRTVTLPKGQYLGAYQSTFSPYPYFLIATDEDGNIVDVVFNYDPEAQTFTCSQNMYINGSRLYLNQYYWFTDVKLQAKPDVAATPAMPIFKNFVYFGTNNPYVEVRIPSYDNEGNLLAQSKLSYMFYTDNGADVQPLVFSPFDYVDLQEDMTEIPYNFGRTWHYDFYDSYGNSDDKVVYLHFPEEEVRSWMLLGVQSIYRGGGETRKTEISWYDVETYMELNGINTQSSIVNGQCSHTFDLQGRRINGLSSKGVYIIGGRKVLVK